MLNETDFDLIDKYLLNQLNEDESNEFKLRCNNVEFADELELMKDAKKIIVNSGRIKLRETLEHIFEQENRKDATIIILFKKLKYPIAACLAIGIIFSTFSIQKNYSKNIYASHGGGASFVRNSIQLKTNEN